MASSSQPRANPLTRPMSDPTTSPTTTASSAAFIDERGAVDGAGVQVAPELVGAEEV